MDRIRRGFFFERYGSNYRFSLSSQLGTGMPSQMPWGSGYSKSQNGELDAVDEEPLDFLQ